MDNGRVAALDAGRALAIVGGVAVHLSFQFPYLPYAVTLVARMGQYGLQLFFVISAITIFMTLESTSQSISKLFACTMAFRLLGGSFFRSCLRTICVRGSLSVEHVQGHPVLVDQPAIAHVRGGSHGEGCCE